jgi:hypothetical protein
MNGLAPRVGFYRTDVHGAVACALCEAPGYTHAPDCPVLTLHTQLRELTAQLGLFVATTRETTEALERLLRGDAWDGPPP